MQNQIETMKRLTYGTELELESITRERAAQAVQSVVGGRVRHEGGTYDKWTVTASDGRVWSMVSDASLSSRANSAEVVTPILRWEDMDTLQEVVRAGTGRRADRQLLVTDAGGHRLHLPLAGKTGTTNGSRTVSFAGGIAGYFYSNGNGGSSIVDCTNSGKVSANANQVNCLGGIVGTMRGKNPPTTHLLKDCTNSGSVTISRTESNANWQSCGGIIGEQESSQTTIQGCTNSGAVRFEMTNTTAHAAGFSVGGIIGFSNAAAANVSLTMSGNSNTGDLTLINNGETASLQSVGGIAGRILANARSTDDSSVCAIVRTVVNPSGAAGAAVGVNNGEVASPAVGGSVNGTAVTAGNLAELAVGSGNAATGAVLAQ